MTIEKYGVCRKGESDPVMLTDDYEEARRVAMNLNAQVIAYKFTLDDSELVEDYSKEEED